MLQIALSSVLFAALTSAIASAIFIALRALISYFTVLYVPDFVFSNLLNNFKSLITSSQIYQFIYLFGLDIILSYFLSAMLFIFTFNATKITFNLSKI
jgi:hypothetical protein